MTNASQAKNDQILNIIGNGQGLKKLGQIAAEMGTKPVVISRNVKALVEAGLIAKDGEVDGFGLTAAGVDRFIELNPAPAVVEETTEPAPAAAKKVAGWPKRPGVVADVWTIAQNNQHLKRKEVIALCQQFAINFHTAKTQYQKWYEWNKANQG